MSACSDRIGRSLARVDRGIYEAQRTFGLVEGEQASDWVARPGDDDLVATCNALKQPAEMRFGDMHIHRLDYSDSTLVDLAAPIETVAR